MKYFRMSRPQVVISVLLTAAVVVVFYFSFFSHTVKPVDINSDIEPRLPVYRNMLTGIPLDEPNPFFTVAVMYDNFFSVKAHAGLEDASIIFEAIAEGDVTRLMALFESSKTVKKIGPIRSVRPYFIDWAESYGGAIMHVGGSPQALIQLRASNLFDIDQIGADEQYFYRDEQLSAPHNVFTSFTNWLKFGENMKIPFASFRPWKYAEPDVVPVRGEIQQVEIVFAPDNHVAWVYNQARNNYLRFFDGERQLYSTGDQISTVNLIIMAVDAKMIDSVGRFEVATVGQGEALLYINGAVHEGNWIKSDQGSRLQFLVDNEEVIFTPGTTWIEVVFDMSIVTSSDILES